MSPSRSNEIASRSIESFLNLNSYLRHGIINNVNIINLATDMIELGEKDPSLVEMLTISSSKLVNRLIQSKELERILELVSRTQECENIRDILSTSTRNYFSLSEFIFDLKEEFPLTTIYSSIFNGIFRNAINIRKAKVINISTGRISEKITLIIKDDGEFIPKVIEEAINDEKIQFDPLIHDNDYFDVFLVKEIFKNIENCTFSLKNDISTGSSYIITFS